MLIHDKKYICDFTLESNKQKNDSFDSGGNISDNKVNNDSKHDSIIEGTIQVENFEKNWKRRWELFISEVLLMF